MLSVSSEEALQESPGAWRCILKQRFEKKPLQDDGLYYVTSHWPPFPERCGQQLVYFATTIAGNMHNQYKIIVYAIKQRCDFFRVARLTDTPE